MGVCKRGYNAISAQLKLQLPTGTELGKNDWPPLTPNLVKQINNFHEIGERGINQKYWGINTLRKNNYFSCLILPLLINSSFSSIIEHCNILHLTTKNDTWVMVLIITPSLAKVMSWYLQEFLLWDDPVSLSCILNK